ncbi:MAG: 50S ribosomal protein L25 [Candidatus Absconditabacteria bacterium]|nr:50S ribosomal protein L25 [Candidatus Absconditabacteria bacterium]
MKLNVNIRQGEKSKDLRKEGNIPAIIYGKHLSAPVSVFCKKNDFIKKFKQAGYSTALTLEGKGVEELVLVQDMQLDPVSDIVLHVDFLAVKKDEKVSTEVPVILVGEAPVEKLGEGKIQLIKDFVEVEAFPQDLPHDIKIDISVIATLNDVVFVKDLKLSDKVKILDDMEQPILTVVTLAEEVEEEAPVETATAEGEASAAPAPEAK